MNIIQNHKENYINCKLKCNEEVHSKYSQNSPNFQGKTQSAKNPSFKSGGFIREADGWAVGGISIWDEDAQRMLTKGYDEKKLQEFFKILDLTTNTHRVLGADIRSTGKFIKRLEATFWCPYRLKNFTEHLEQKIIGETPWEFFDRMTNQYVEYCKQLTDDYGINPYK